MDRMELTKKLFSAFTDWDGSAMHDDEWPREVLRCKDLREIVAAMKLLEEERESWRRVAERLEIKNINGLERALSFEKDARRYKKLRECGVDSYIASGSGPELDVQIDKWEAK